jgi:hypothetical protein
MKHRLHERILLVAFIFLAAFCLFPTRSVNSLTPHCANDRVGAVCASTTEVTKMRPFILVLAESRYLLAGSYRQEFIINLVLAAGLATAVFALSNRILTRVKRRRHKT